MKLSFTDHPKKIGESYLQHLLQALIFSSTSLLAALVCFIHGLFPFLFTNTGGDMIARLSDKITKRVKRKCACATSYVPMKRSMSTPTMKVKADGKGKE